MADPHPQVLIVGAGPTGLMLALQLARQGVRLRLIDRHAGPAQQSRAMAVHARTLEIYAQLGIAERAIDRGFVATGANLWANGQRRARIPIGDIGQGLSAYPFVLMLGQDLNEHILNARLAQDRLAVEWRTELREFEQHEHGVHATLRHADGSEERIDCDWLAGCDGARSRVRERCGIEFVGAPYDQVFFVADTVATGPMVPGEVNVFFWEGGFHLFFPMRGEHRWRAIGMLPPALKSREGVTFDDVAPNLAAAVGGGLSFAGCLWFSTYRIAHRSAERFRSGRCFLLGDAAHIHSPVGGQGMNTGLQDAYNLGWKLGMVVRQVAREDLLDTYEQERLPVAGRLLDTTDRAFSAVVSDATLAKIWRTRLLTRIAATAMRVQRIRRLAFMTVSQIGIHYPESTLSVAATDAPQTGPQPGDRFPWMSLFLRGGAEPVPVSAQFDGRSFTLVAIGQEPSALATLAAGSRLVVVDAPRDGANEATLRVHGIEGPAYFVVRPDGHIGLAGRNLGAEAVRTYLRGIMRSSVGFA